MSLTNILTVLGLLATVVFGIWSVIKGGRLPSRVGLMFLLLAFLYAAQFLSAKWLVHPLLSDTSFSILVTFLVFGIFYTTRDSQT